MKIVNCVMLCLVALLVACERTPTTAPSTVAPTASLSTPDQRVLATATTTPCVQAGNIVVQFAQYVSRERVSDILIELGLYWSVSGMSVTAGPNPYWSARIRVPAGAEQDTMRRLRAYAEVDDVERLRCDNVGMLTQSTLAPTPTRSTSPEPTHLPIPPSPTPSYWPTLQPIPILTTTSTKTVAFIAGDKPDGKPDALWLANLDGSGQEKLLDDVTQIGAGISNRLAWSPNGKWLAVTRRGGLWLLANDGTQGREVVGYDQRKGPVYLFAWSPDSRRIAFTQQHGYDPNDHLSLAVFERATNHVVTVGTQSPQWAWASHLSWMADGSRIALLNGVAGSVFTLSAQSNAFAIPHCLGEFRDVQWSPDGRWLAHWEYGNGRFAAGMVCLDDLHGNIMPIALERSDVNRHYTNPLWSHNGRSLYLLAMNLNEYPPQRREPQLLRFDVGTKQLLTVASLPEDSVSNLGSQISLALSPDGQWVSTLNVPYDVAQGRASKRGFTVISTDGKTIREWAIPAALHASANHHWSADGRRIMFSAADSLEVDGHWIETHQSLYSLDVVTGQIAMVTDQYQIPAWVVSPTNGNAE